MTEEKTTAPAKTGAEGGLPAPRGTAERHPLLSLRDEMDRVFDDLFASFPLVPFGGRRLAADPWRRFQGMFEATFPTVDVAEHDSDYRITAEVPGMKEKDIDLSLAGGVLTIRGEKKQEKEEKKEDFYVSERRYGSFQRSFRLPEDVDADKVEASFKSGILTITLPKSAEAEARRKKIAIKAA